MSTVYKNIAAAAIAVAVVTMPLDVARAMSCVDALRQNQWNNATNGQYAQGRRESEGLLAYLLDVTDANRPQASRIMEATSPQQDDLIVTSSYAIVSGDTNLSNQTHLAEHLAVATEAFARAGEVLPDGMTFRVSARNILIHDLGKVLSEAPESMRAFFSSIFPGNFLATAIFPHEFFSMAILGNLDNVELSDHQLNYLRQVIARHNAGYEALAGFHFWANLWGPVFANRLRELDVDIPGAYPKILTPGQAAFFATPLGRRMLVESVFLTAIDRGGSMYLSSQWKFAGALLSPNAQGDSQWNNARLIAQLMNTAGENEQDEGSVLAEVQSVLLQAQSAFSESGFRTFYDSIFYQFTEARDPLVQLATLLRDSSSATNRPTLDVDADSVIFLRLGTSWHAVTREGHYYQANDGDVAFARVNDPALADMSAPDILFLRVVFPHFNYTPLALPTLASIRNNVDRNGQR